MQQKDPAVSWAFNPLSLKRANAASFAAERPVTTPLTPLVNSVALRWASSLPFATAMGELATMGGGTGDATATNGFGTGGGVAGNVSPFTSFAVAIIAF